DLTATWAHQMDADGIVASNKVSEQIMAKYGLDQTQVDIIAGVALSALGGVSKAGKGSGTSASSVAKPSINQGQQNKHVPGTNEYKIASEAGLNKSVLTVQSDSLLSKLGTGQQVGNAAIGTPGSKERINYGKVIGNYIDPQTGVSTPTTNGIVHYGKKWCSYCSCKTIGVNSTMKKSTDFNNYFKLSIQRALLSNVTNNMRAIMAELSENYIKLFFYYDGEVHEDDEEIVSEIEAEVMADFDEHCNFDVSIIRLDYPNPIKNGNGFCVYLRKEC
ncbi:MAG: polymorphic toxin type 50 domain-containing protein, partial [Pantoea sp.]|nr:polymorphic toxin type 50 domain-containing protein [Pantoea sp.]